MYVYHIHLHILINMPNARKKVFIYLPKNKINYELIKHSIKNQQFSFFTKSKSKNSCIYYINEK